MLCPLLSLRARRIRRSQKPIRLAPSYGARRQSSNLGEQMNRWIRYPLLVSGICIAICPALPAAPSGVAAVKCGANQDRVWVYDSLTSFEVEAKIPCGDTVEIVSRVKGYVKIRTASGVDGYVPENALPDLPPFEDQQYDLGSHSARASESAADEPTSLGTIAAAYRAERLAAESPTAPQATNIAKEAVSSAPPKALAAVAPAQTASVEASAPRRPEPFLAASARTQPVVRANVSVPPPARAAVPSAAVAVAPVASPDAANPPIPAPTDIPSAAAPADAAMREAAAKPIGTTPESEDYPDTEPQDASTDPNCRVYFSAYGLGAEQYKWLSDTRQKQFSGICPAPNLQSVDFVILFTHDSDSYIAAMPTPVHTDGSGFSDFDPMTTVDSALMSPTEADKAHYELAWVFRVKRGGFDPAAFSLRRRPEYTTTSKGSHASTKAVEDAFDFIRQQSPTR
jgi:hypothetical protein